MTSQALPHTRRRTSAAGQQNEHAGVLRIVGFLSFFDRFATAPLLLLASRDLHVGMGAAVQLVTVYALFYAVGQPFWGALSDRIGRRRVLLVALGGMVAGSAVSVIAPTFFWLIIARAATGLFVGALFPTVLTIVGDVFTGPARSRQISDLQTFTALGTTAATLLAGIIGVAVGWRAIFAVAGVAALVLFFLARSVRDAARSTIERRLRDSFGRWPVALYIVGILEGAVLLGILTYIVPALERDGVSVQLAGLLGSAYGVGIIVGAATSKRVAHRWARWIPIAVGSITLIVAYAVAAGSQTLVALTVTAALVGLSNSFLHSTLQGLATELTPSSRATTVSLFVSAVFVGSSLATAVTATETATGYGPVFLQAAIAGVIVAASSVLFAVLWERRTSR
ncbi:MFS transporter [Curtobacterium flaccumfaciens]|uniref:MFS transporter n=1 Tax=Curtobacterium flaccumfaciens TaxID=2035 RepID=UPI003F7E7492